jgi:hypothetical protein
MAVNFANELSLSYSAVFFNTVKSYNMGPLDLLPLRRKLCYGSLSELKNPSTSAGFETATLGSNGKHVSH